MAKNQLIPTIPEFIKRWSNSYGSERGNFHSFFKELCKILGVDEPDPVNDGGDNAYVFERLVTWIDDDGKEHPRWIDCYKREHFVLEAKQATATGANRRGGAAHAGRLIKAKKQAIDYVRSLDPLREPPIPFLIVLDVGGSFDLYADFSRTNRFWTHYPDSNSSHITLDDLVKPEICARLKAIWEDPYSLDPSTKAQQVTKEAAIRLATIAKQLEEKNDPETVAGFLMRFFFCAFAEDIGLMKPHEFTRFLSNHIGRAHVLKNSLELLWSELDSGGDRRSGSAMGY